MRVRREEIASKYNQVFGPMSEVQIPAIQADSQHAWHLYMLRLNADRLRTDRAQFVEELKKRNIGASVHFIPIPLHSYYRAVLEARDPCETALSQYPRLVSLPLYAAMSDQDVQKVINAVLEVIARTRKVRVFAAAAVGCA